MAAAVPSVAVIKASILTALAAHTADNRASAATLFYACFGGDISYVDRSERHKTRFATAMEQLRDEEAIVVVRDPPHPGMRPSFAPRGFPHDHTFYLAQAE